jgi:hypothetical protein
MVVVRKTLQHAATDTVLVPGTRSYQAGTLLVNKVCRRQTRTQSSYLESQERTSRKKPTMTLSVPPSPLDDPTLADPLECPPLRWGMIGCGRVSHDFTQCLKHLPTQTVIACAARSVDSAKSFAEKHGIANHCKFFFVNSLISVSTKSDSSLLTTMRRNLC